MSRRRELEAGIHSIREIRDILNAMENMARMQVHRLGRFLVAQQRVVAGIEAAGSDFLAFHADLFPRDEHSRQVNLLLGSERGFCGDFNEALLHAFDRQRAHEQVEVVVLGSKLKAKLPGDFRAAAFLESAGVVEEVEGVLVRLMNTVSGLKDSGSDAGPLRVTVFHHHAQGEDVRISVLDPFKYSPCANTRFACPPHLYLAPAAFADGLIRQYLLARLQELLYCSLMVENQIRIQHMDSAVRRLDKRSAELLRRRNILRQEEITEEIENIMLSADVPG